ncbi:MAG: beta-ketoacyl synthase N-terminal-like domain-containing protein, partial [Desulfurivibrionaceae bacterium]
PLDLFPLLHGEPLPVGRVRGLDEQSALPRTHRLAHIAAMQAMASCRGRPEAVILGNTTGGILTTEQLLRDKVDNKELYRYHGLNSVSEYIAREIGCSGPALAVSTACSSGAVAIGMALEMLRSGKMKTVLAGGVDSLCRLTYFGFHSLQLVDRTGCKPLDADRHGMAVAEGAAILLLTTEKPDNPLAELLGAGLSCDAYHPAAPHPAGRGALMAMQAALADAGLGPADIDYINLHGTGTPENDLAEAKAINTLFAAPPLSSIKGATGHSLAASGAIEAVVSAIAVSKNFLPANTGWQKLDPVLGLTPLTQPTNQRTTAVLSNSFGFGGNNGCLVIAAPDRFPPRPPKRVNTGLAIHGFSCLTGAGNTAATMSLLAQGVPVAGAADLDSISKNLPPHMVRRLKRLPRMTLSLALGAHQDSAVEEKPAAIFMGTGWGALSETYDFLTRLIDTNEQFPSPTDFIGSVHNGPAGQAAIMFGATGANITTSGGDYSFEQALLAADLLMEKGRGSCFVLGADEGHQVLSPLLDPSIAPETFLADGGGAFCLSRSKEGARCLVRLPFYQSSATEGCINSLIDALGGVQTITGKYALLLAGVPAAVREEGEGQLARFMEQSGLKVPVVRYREFTGEFASASAVAAVMAASFLTSGKVPGPLVSGDALALERNKNAILVLGLGRYLSAMEFSRP